MTSRRDIEFPAEDGTVLRGWLYEPEGGGPSPTVVMAHGFSAVKEMYLDDFAAAFADAGLAALVYDHRNLGASDGTPRGDIDPRQQIDDYRTPSRSPPPWTPSTATASGCGAPATPARTCSWSPRWTGA